MTYIIILLILVAVGTVAYIVKNSSNESSVEPVDRQVTFKVSTSTDEEQSKDDEYNDYAKKHPKWFSSEDTVGICFESERIEPLTKNQTETVHYKSDRYADLFGRGKDCSYFPGYGEIHNRTFEVWFQKTNSKEKSDIQIYKDIANVTYAQPVYIEKVTNGINMPDELERTKGYLKLFKGKDVKNRRTWYAGFVESEFTGIIAKAEEDSM
ncbi:MAG: hypothetical protein QNK23_16375 [Crocinitomicaceae bacterium]|nr:hypothetical protein [Crocinitomicaceae bacterium]